MRVLSIKYVPVRGPKPRGQVLVRHGGTCAAARGARAQCRGAALGGTVQRPVQAAAGHLSRTGGQPHHARGTRCVRYCVVHEAVGPVHTRLSDSFQTRTPTLAYAHYPIVVRSGHHNNPRPYPSCDRRQQQRCRHIATANCYPVHRYVYLFPWVGEGHEHTPMDRAHAGSILRCMQM
jgi:hypothetical protein